jgi:signal transduction histidine kinase
MLIRRTARILAISRAILALVFLIAVWLEPTEPARTAWLGYGLLIVYFTWSCLIAAIAWSGWWWDFLLARYVQVIDIVVFEAAVFLTETAADDFSSPFLAFSAFLLITASVRWGLRDVIWTALALIGLYALAGAVFYATNIWIDPYQFGRRLTYMIALSAMMIWLSAERRVSRIEPLSDPGGIPGKRRHAVMAGALAHARRSFYAQNAAIAVTRYEEPWVDLFRDSDGVFASDPVGPGPLTEDLERNQHSTCDAALFDLSRKRRIVAQPDYRLVPLSGDFGYALADLCEATQGLIARFSSVGCHGHVLVWGVRDASIDDLPVITALARDIGRAIDREDMAVLDQSIVVWGVRNDLARDLHDSVAQFLAGTLFRLEALRRWIREGNDPDPEIVAMKDAFRGEQGQLRAMIDRLRRGVGGDRGTDIVAEFETLMLEMGQHWQVGATLHCDQRPITVSMGLAHELRLLVREAVANAVRHGACSKVDLHVNGQQDGLLQISISDNGNGFPSVPGASRPRSISERITALGGRMHIISDASGAQLHIEVPLPSLE